MSVHRITERLPRLIPSRYDHIQPRPSVLRNEEIAPTDAEFDVLLDLDNLSNERVATGQGQSNEPYGYVRLGCFAHPSEGRFSRPLPGQAAWYAADSLQTALKEVGYHLALRAVADGSPNSETPYTRYSSFVDNDLLDAHSVAPYAEALERDENDYTVSQAVADVARGEGIPGIHYRSVRAPGGTCVALLHTWAVTHIERHEVHTLVWNAETQALMAKTAERSE